MKTRTAGAGFPVINMDAFIWKEGNYRSKKNGLPKHSHTRTTQLTRRLLIYRIMRHVKNFVQKINYIHSLLKRRGNPAYLVFGMVRHHQVFIDENKIDTKIFRDFEEATKWLGIDVKDEELIID